MNKTRGDHIIRGWLTPVGRRGEVHGFGRMINPVVKIMTNVAETHPSRGQYGNIVGEFSSDQACREIF
jgi:hypothetical protein